MTPKTYFTGGDNWGWALDHDLEMTRRALTHIVTPASLKEADIIHAVSWSGLEALPPSLLAEKQIICHMPGEPLRYFRLPGFSRIAAHVDIWVAQNRQAAQQLTDLGLTYYHIPYTVDTAVFHPLPADHPDLISLRQRWQIPDNAYLIGNFHRDSEQKDLNTPKLVKGPDLFLAIVRQLREQGVPIHIILAGPRRHWLRAQLTAAAIPYTFIGQITVEDDKTANLLDHETINRLYNLLDLCLVTSRSEGGPRAILEAAAANCKIISTPVGLAEDVLEPTAVYPDPPAAIQTIAQDWRTNHLAALLPIHRQKVMDNHRPETAAPRFAELYDGLTASPARIDAPPSLTLDVQQAYWRAQISQKIGARSPIRRLWQGYGRPALKRARALRQSWRARRAPTDKPIVCLWHEFVKPPYGGGNQFMLALRKGLQARGYTIVENTFSPSVDVYILNSIHFDVPRFLEYARAHDTRVIHRIDGPIHLIRGHDREKDELCYAINKEFAQATVVQSNWTFRQMVATGYYPVNPVALHNAADPDIFHRHGRPPRIPGDKIRLISTSWSDNPRKGGPVYKWIEEHLDWERYDYTFVGRASEPFDRIRLIPPVPSEELADILRQHDIYITASQNDPCSNALIEALSCGLPALYLNDGGHPELVGFGGLPFRKKTDIMPQLDKLAAHLPLFQSLISVSPMAHVIDVYESLIAQVMEG